MAATRETIPSQVILVTGEVLGEHYYSHSRLNALFAEAGAPGDPPDGNCVNKCQAWFRRCNEDLRVRPLSVLAELILPLMEHDQALQFPEWAARQQRLAKVLQRNGLEYLTGGQVVRAGVTVSARTLAEVLRERDFPSIEVEFSRASSSAASDPPAALTAACSIVEAACKVYIEAQGLPMPAKQTIKPLWSVVQGDLGLDPKNVEDDDLRRILGGLSSVVDGLGSLRTHAGSAHGRGGLRYRVSPRHARLAVSTAHTLVLFLLETWADRAGT